MSKDKKKIRLYNNRYFMESPQGPIVVGSKCKSCGRVFFPKKNLCAHCFKRDGMEVVPLSKRGKLHTFGIGNRSHMGLKTPFAVGYIDLPEKVRIFSLLTDCDPLGELKIGIEMEMVIDTLMTDEFGYEVITYKFKPVR